MIHQHDKAAVGRLKAIAKRHDMRLCKSRERTCHLNNRGGLQLVNPPSNTVLAGVDYDLDVQGAAYWIGHYAAQEAWCRHLPQDQTPR